VNAEEFNTEMLRLSAQFSKASYSKERVELIAREVQSMSAYWWKRTVDRLLGECRQAPLLPEIRVLVAEERSREWERRKKQAELNPQVSNRTFCSRCDSTGVVRAKLKSEPTAGPFAFLCSCDNGERDSRRFPTWSSAEQDDYELVRVGA
jgi:hypothetical protein